MKVVSLLAAAAATTLVLGLCAPASAAISMATVPVGNPGNEANPLSSYGQVDYSYNIGKYEVTAGQYTVFLNAVATSDTYGLYCSPDMGVVGAWGGGIIRDGEAGHYSYRVDPAYANKPVNYVSFWDACRFVNWMSNGQPTGAQGPGTTETGSYTLTAQGIANNTVTRNADAIWVLPNADEWHKAAFYNPATSSYYLYATSSNSVPGTNLTDASGNNADWNFAAGVGMTTVVGQFQNSASPYGTFDQCGNVNEWTEKASTYSRVLAGGAWIDNDPNWISAAEGRAWYGATGQGDTDGFRVALVPEPSSLALLTLAGAGLLARRRGARR